MDSESQHRQGVLLETFTFVHPVQSFPFTFLRLLSEQYSMQLSAFFTEAVEFQGSTRG